MIWKDTTDREKAEAADATDCYRSLTGPFDDTDVVKALAYCRVRFIVFPISVTRLAALPLAFGRLIAIAVGDERSLASHRIPADRSFATFG